MEALGPRDDSASPASSTPSLDLRRLSTRADSAYGSFSAPEARTPSPRADLHPYLDWEYVRVVWGGPAPAPPDADPPTTQRPRPAVAACCEPWPPEVQGTPGPLSRQATPLLYALAAEAEAGARAAEPPSPPASWAAYRQRLQGAQRRVLRETSFQRKELRMSLPTRLRPAVPARPPTAHPRSASLSHPGGEVGPTRSGAPAPGSTGPGRLANQQRKWCFSEPGKLDCMGRGGGLAGECLSLACSSSGLNSPEPQELQAEVKGLQRWAQAEAQPQNTAELNSGSTKLGNGCRPATRSQSPSGEVLGPWKGPGGAMAPVQAVSQAGENPRPLFQTRLSSTKTFLPGHCGQCGIPASSRFLTQKEAALVHPGEDPQSSPAKCEQEDSEICMESPYALLPSLPDDEVFLEETLHVGMRSPPDSHVLQEFPISVHASDQQCGTGLGQRAGQASVPPECTLHECPGTAGAGDCWQEMNGSVGIHRPTSYILPGTANGDISIIDTSGLLTTDHPVVDALGPSGNDKLGSPHHTSLAWGTGQPGSKPTWPGQRLEELVQELARLDPSLSDTLTSQPCPEPPLGLLDGLIPLAEVWAAMKPGCGEAGEEGPGTSEPGSYQFNFTQLLPTSQEMTSPENSPSCPVPDCPSAQTSNNNVQAKKVELAGLLQEMLQDLHIQEERLQGAAQEWTRRRVALESAVGQACAPRELERFSRFLADLERVLGLLLLLGSRLARVHHALARMGPDGDPDERDSLLQRLGLLQQQQEDAKELKEHVARRERALREVLARALSVEELCSYSELLVGKATILAQQRCLEEHVRLFQNQLDALGSNLGLRPISPRPSWPPETCPRDKPPFLPPSI
ncbi:protein Shroom1 isoform 1-T3 [Callospermophilus lateralis]|uniref:protein Shroom1 isoform X1 n=1 Tax=Callospermophilus lateralis TaxID=76772 RepID=UPI0040542F72